MEKWEQQLKKNVNQSIPGFIDHRIEDTLKTLHNRNKTKSKLLYILSAAVIMIGMTFGLTMISPAFANTMKDIPLIGTAFEFVGDIGMKKGKKENLTTELGEQIEIDGHLITFTETLYDGGQIHIGYLMQGDDNPRVSNFNLNLKFSINGKSLNSSGSSSYQTKIEDGLDAGTISIDIPNNLPDSFLLGIRPHDDHSWFIELPVEKKGEHQVFLINEEKKVEDLMILYDHITFFPTSTRLTLQLLIDEKAYENNKYGWLDYLVIDEKGRVLQPLSGLGKGEFLKGKMLNHFEQSYEPLQTIPKSLTIKPYLIDFNDTSSKTEKVKWDGEVVTLSQGEIGHITILNSIEEDGIITFTFEVEGEVLNRQADVIWLEDSDGIEYHHDQAPIRVDGSFNQYQISFSEIPSSNKLYIATRHLNPPQFIEELEVTIDLTE